MPVGTLLEQETSIDVKNTCASLRPCLVFSMHELFSHKYSFKLCSSTTAHVSKCPCVTHTKSNWKWIPKYVTVDCDVWKRMCNCLDAKVMQFSNFLCVS
jgi:hypothetical protein